MYPSSRKRLPAKRSLANAHDAGGDHQLTGDLCKGQQAGVPEDRKKLRGVQQQLRQRLERRPGRQDRPHRIPAVCCVQQGRPQGGCQFVRRHQRTVDGKPQRPKDGEGQQAKDQHRQKRLLFLIPAHHPKSDTVDTRRSQAPAPAARRRQTACRCPATGTSC